MKKIFIYGKENDFKNYTDALIKCGAQPLLSENTEEIALCDGLLLPGGDDISPVLYGEKNAACLGVDTDRDSKELFLIKAASALNMPVLGICRGIQTLNVAFGGNLIQDIPTANVHKATADGDRRHTVSVSKQSFLYDLYGDSFYVNSSHHQAVNTAADCFTVSAVSEDGIIEALENRERRIYSVQWHPERIAFSHFDPACVDGRKIFDFFLELC